jgi:5-methylcytosine-specific restriction endonuclease McrA
MARKKRYQSYDKEKYHRYLASRAWWLKRQAVMKRAGGKCEKCKINPATAVHHLSYLRVYNEYLTDLQAICQQCHEREHAIGE